MKTGGGVARSLCPKRPGLSSTPCRPQTYTLWHCISLPHCFCDKEKGRKGVSWAGSPAWSQAQGGGEGNKRTWDQRSWSGFGAGPGSAALSFIHPSYRQDQLWAFPSSKSSCPPPSSPITPLVELWREAISMAKSSDLT